MDGWREEKKGARDDKTSVHRQPLAASHAQEKDAKMHINNTHTNASASSASNLSSIHILLELLTAAVEPGDNRR